MDKEERTPNFADAEDAALQQDSGASADDEAEESDAGQNHGNPWCSWPVLVALLLVVVAASVILAVKLRTPKKSTTDASAGGTSSGAAKPVAASYMELRTERPVTLQIASNGRAVRKNRTRRERGRKPIGHGFMPT
eukprot:TRINITY_DN13662_c0_g1_i2.p1 TRINITY_DN13662_c0_g1~~TRINITY_DN13662_c0_g1_i2.p1  ORF type:complete len:136 (+),score=20.18 TRINITY_DN13662_c0_g1_i2:206-613(+)